MTHYSGHLDGGDGLMTRIARIFGIAISVGVVVFLAWTAWTIGTRDASQVPVIQAMDDNVRERPADAGGAEIPDQGLALNDVLATDEPAAAENEVALAPEPDTLENVAPVENTDNLPDALVNRDLAETDEDNTAPASSGTANENAVLDENDRIDAMVAEAAAGGNTADQPTITMETPTNRPSNLGVVAQVATLPAVAVEAPAQTETPAAVQETVASVPSGTPVIQLGAFDSAAVVRDQWAERSSANSDILGGKSLFVQEADVNGRTFYRLRVTGFDGLGAAQQACQALINRGLDCIAVNN